MYDPQIDSQLDAFYTISDDIRYVALYRDNRLALRQRDGIADDTLLESDKYEELIANPSMIKIAYQRGRIDCGGLDYLLVRYGKFFELVMPISDGHVSICFQPESNPLNFIDDVSRAVEALPAL